MAAITTSTYTYQLCRSVFFIGFMGAGKTSVARKLARMCGIVSVDVDTYLERREGRSVKEIFDTDGESVFRVLETEVLYELAHKDPLLIACGGGVVTSPANQELLRNTGFVVYLMIAADEARSRIRDISTRPLFGDIESARRRNQERAPLYEAVADVTIATTGRSVFDVACEVKSLLIKKGVLCQQPR